VESVEAEIRPGGPPGAVTSTVTPDGPGPHGPPPAHRLSARRSTALWRDVLGSHPFQNVCIAVLCTIATWVPVDLAPRNGLDPSWSQALSMAFVHHLAWGPRIDFTYGPLGFVSQQVLTYGSTAAIALIYVAVVSVATFTLLIYWARRSFSLPVSVIVSYVVGATAVALLDTGDLIIVPVILFGMACLTQVEVHRRQIGMALFGLVAGIALLEKFSDGVVAVVVLAAIAAAGTGRRWMSEAAIGGASFVATVVIAWVATGNSLADLGSYLRYSVAVSDGYASAMQIETGRTDEWWYALLAVLVIGAVAVCSLWRSPTRVKAATAVVLVAALWWGLKEGFVRHDGHDLIFFGFVPALLLVLPVRSSRLRQGLVAGVALLIIVAWTAAGAVPTNLLGVLKDASGLRTEAATILNGRTRTATIDAARQTMQQAYGLDATQLRELDGHTVAIEQLENAVAWAYPSMTWDPEPVVQAYSAYTTTLDQLDANFLTSDAAPSRILQQPPVGLDGRDPFFEPPTTWVTMMCHYRQLNATAQWQILARGPDRCGPLRPIGQVHAAFGAKVVVPRAPAGDAVVARFVQLPLSLGYQVSALALKPPVTSLVTPAATYRFVVPTAGDLHVLRPAPAIGYSAPYGPTAISSFDLTGAGVAPGSGRYEVEFYAMAVRP
jgi:hypothetical protein